LRIGIRRAEALLRVLRIERWHIAIIAAFVATLWIVEALGSMHERGVFIF